MGEARRILPCVLRVAIGAAVAQLPAVDIAMASRAGCFEARERGVEIVTLEYGAVPGIDVFGGVAPGALQLRMLAFEPPSGLRVVQFLLGNRPAHEPVIQPVVLRMAACAVVTARTGVHLRGMVAALLRQTVGNLLMAVQTTELRCSRPEHVATGALQWSCQVVMRFAEGAGRHLSR